MEKVKTIIEMASLFGKRPSEIVFLGGHEAFCFDEVCMLYLAAVTQKDGTKNWNKMRWKDEKEKRADNREIIAHVKRFGKVR